MSSQVTYFADQVASKRVSSGGLPFLLIPLVVAGLCDLPGDVRGGTISLLGVSVACRSHWPASD